MATIRKMWRCANTNCKNEKGKHRGYKKVCTGEKEASCIHCGSSMVLSENHRTRIMKDGKTHTKSVSPLKGDAEAYLASCITARHSGALMPGEERLIPWSEAKELFEKELEKRIENGKSANTDRVYKSRLRLLTAKFGKRYLQDIERYEVEDFRDERRKVTGASDINCTLSILHLVYSTVLDRFSTKKFPRLQEALNDIEKVKKMDLPKGRDNILETSEQIQSLLDECKTDNLYHFAYGILNTGLRHVDILKLRIPEISFNRNEIVTHVKGGKQVRIPLTNEYRAFLEKWIKDMKVVTIQGWVFPSTKKPGQCFRKNTNFGWDAMKERVAKKYDAKKDRVTAAKFRALVPHDLRHTFATHFLYKASKELGATAAVHILSQALGHSTSYITQRYSHALDEINQAAMKSFGDQMWGEIERR